MRVLVCGGRDFSDAAAVSRELDALALSGPLTLIEGGAFGADRLARLWALRKGLEVVTFPANWKLHGKAAGPLRNQEMLDAGRPDLVVAFVGGRGTADMVRRARAAGVKVREVSA
ncbi:DUF2493 domain-containing protein [Hyphomicrobium sulfonivorans]